MGLGLGLVGGWWVAGRGPDRLTAAGLAAARGRWEALGPESYLLEIETRGPAGARQVVEVRGGEVVRMTTGGVEASREAWRYWTVDALFSFLATELANADAAESTYRAPAGSVVLKASFDGRWGFPSRFLRHVLGQRDSVEWRVLRFEPLPAGE
ncbi:MAG: DUF6174 domain-containing protein [Thermoanaerobaculia bacterium]